MNDGIDEGCCSLLYVSTHNQTRAIRSSCQEAMLAKVNIRNTHRIVPIKPDDRWLLGMSWKGAIYVDTTLMHRWGSCGSSIVLIHTSSSTLRPGPLDSYHSVVPGLPANTTTADSTALSLDGRSVVSEHSFVEWQVARPEVTPLGRQCLSCETQREKRWVNVQPHPVPLAAAWRR